MLGNDCRCPRSGLCTDATCIRCVLPRRAVMRRLGCRCRVLPIPAWWLLHGSSRLYVLCPVERRNCSPSMNRRSHSVSAGPFPLPSLCAAGPVGLPDAVRPLPRPRISYRLTAACGGWSGLGVALSSLFSAARGHLFLSSVQAPSSHSVTRWLPPTSAPCSPPTRRTREVTAHAGFTASATPCAGGHPVSVVVVPITASACMHVCTDTAWFEATFGPAWAGPEEWHSR